MKDSQNPLIDQFYMVITKYCNRKSPLSMIDIMLYLQQLFTVEEINGESVFGDGAQNKIYWSGISSELSRGLVRIWTEKKMGFYECNPSIYISHPEILEQFLSNKQNWIPLLLEPFKEENSVQYLNQKLK
ncbi:hypothetical protein [Candidatus Lokiarchaeum ossiferum]|uniref:hypothetical protein n=1 Tax=Candidatus Lokiarchaeum ossiferum TaxID=2951803 RepID=UPI00352FC810